MSARYYAAMVDVGGNLREVPGPPCDTYDKVIAVHVREINRADPWDTDSRRRVLLDLGSLPIPGEIHELAALLHNDPVLKAVFELGRRAGWAGR